MKRRTRNRHTNKAISYAIDELDGNGRFPIGDKVGLLKKSLVDYRYQLFDFLRLDQTIEKDQSAIPFFTAVLVFYEIFRMFQL